MDLVERYLHAVGFWLPRSEKRDIIAELSEDISSQIEERERELGHPLEEAEVGTLLEQRGSPVMVATRYLPQECLIGPTLFPIYRFVLMIVVTCYLVPWILVWIGLMTFDSAYRASRTGGHWIRTLGAFWSDFWIVGLAAIGAVTLVFAVLERSHARSALLDRWDPHKLPAVRDPNRIPRADTIAELAGNMVFCGWWIAAMSSSIVFDRPDVRVTLASTWPYFFWSYLLLSVATIAAAGVNLFRPWWTRRRAAVRLATDLMGSALFCVLCSSSIVADINVAGVSPARAEEITRAINMWMGRAVPFVVAVGGVVFAFDLRRMVRASTRARPVVTPRS